MFEQFLAILVGMVDTVMISSVGEAAVSGVSLVDNINILVINITAAMATGGAVVAGHFLGQKEFGPHCVLFSECLQNGIHGFYLINLYII